MAPKISIALSQWMRRRNRLHKNSDFRFELRVDLQNSDAGGKNQGGSEGREYRLRNLHGAFVNNSVTDDETIWIASFAAGVLQIPIRDIGYSPARLAKNSLRTASVPE